LFFFRAEDGIRDFHVTGVQTCALPISSRSAGSWSEGGIWSSCAAERSSSPSGPETPRGGYCASATSTSSIRRETSPTSTRWAPRSEERRVGKECEHGHDADPCRRHTCT